MPKSNTTKNDVIKFMFHGTAMPSYGANLQVNLHVSPGPGNADTDDTNPATYTSYAPVSVTRDNTKWQLCDSDGTPNANGRCVKNIDEVTFPECTGVSDDETQTHASISINATNQVLYYGALTASVRVTYQDTPRFPAGTLILGEA